MRAGNDNDPLPDYLELKEINDEYDLFPKGAMRRFKAGGSDPAGRSLANFLWFAEMESLFREREAEARREEIKPV